MRPGKVVLLIAGTLIALTGLLMAIGAGALGVLLGTERDAAGYLNSSTQQFSTSTYALTARIPVAGPGSSATWGHNLVTLRLRVGGSSPVFIGIAPQAAVDRWLANSAHEELTRIGFVGQLSTASQLHPGTAAPAPPGAQTFWVASATGSGTQTLSWAATAGNWEVVVMNADAAPGVAVGVSAGVKIPALIVLAIVLGVIGILILGTGITLVAVSLVRRGRPEATPTPSPALPAAAVRREAGPYPVHLEGRLEEPLSRWMWLAKIILVIPHLIVLWFLWVAAFFATVAAWFAILFTGHYPRAIFRFATGVMRWTWRVEFYSFGAFATDLYPPFRLAPDPSYPADLTVDYPDHLSRGLALVKWWLLAIPQYLIVGILVGGAVFATTGGRWPSTVGGGLIGILALVAAVVLAATRRYPEGLFDFLMGLHRWVWRVAAYALLMRDEYPPFRLDPGPTEPGSQPQAPPVSPLPGNRLGLAQN